MPYIDGCGTAQGIYIHKTKYSGSYYCEVCGMLNVDRL